MAKANTRKRSRPLDEPVSWNVTVDPLCKERVGIAQVLCDGDTVWDANLNLTNYSRSNNKFIKLQLLKLRDRRSYSVWCRGGRIGTTGKGNLVTFGPYINKAKQHFKSKFYEKTQNEWDDRREFKRVKGCHDLMDVNLTKAAIVDEKPSVQFNDEFDKQIEELMEMIHGLSDIWTTRPLDSSPICVWTESSGLLPSEKQIQCAIEVLKEMHELLQNSDTVSKQRLIELSDEFYTKIPHNYGNRKPPNITCKSFIWKKLLEMETLRTKLVSPKTPLQDLSLSLNRIANNFYNLLQCKIVPLKSESDMFKLIDKYLTNSHGETHQYAMKIVNAFECTKTAEGNRFKNLGNRKLLWHGSLAQNFSGILGDGLRVPAFNPSRLLMFGRGVYFADRSSKSANYCGYSTVNRHGLLMLCEVSLGLCEVLLQPNSLAVQPSAGYDSIKGEGFWIPDKTEEITLSDGTMVPLGKCTPNSLESLEQRLSPLFYNEYVVYNPDQIKMRYLVKVEFVSKKEK